MCVSQKTRELYEPEKPFLKLRPAYSVKAVKIKITAKFCDTEHLFFEDTKRIVTRKVSGLSRNGPRDCVLVINRANFTLADFQTISPGEYTGFPPS